MNITCIIPARLKSTRLSNKVLRHIGHKTVLQCAWECASYHFDNVFCAVDDLRLAKEVESFGGKYIITSVSCMDGTHRVAESLGLSDSDIWVNWQGDLVFVDTICISDLLKGIGKGSGVVTLKKEAKFEENPNIVKVVTDSLDNALYFSRASIPYKSNCYKHIGIYLYTRKTLEKIRELPRSELAISERLEQLTLLENGIPIYTPSTAGEYLDVNTSCDLNKIGENLASMP